MLMAIAATQWVMFQNNNNMKKKNRLLEWCPAKVFKKKNGNEYDYEEVE